MKEFLASFFFGPTTGTGFLRYLGRLAVVYFGVAIGSAIAFVAGAAVYAAITPVPQMSVEPPAITPPPPKPDIEVPRRKREPLDKEASVVATYTPTSDPIDQLRSSSAAFSDFAAVLRAPDESAAVAHFLRQRELAARIRTHTELTAHLMIENNQLKARVRELEMEQKFLAVGLAPGIRSARAASESASHGDDLLGVKTDIYGNETKIRELKDALVRSTRLMAAPTSTGSRCVEAAGSIYCFFKKSDAVGRLGLVVPGRVDSLSSDDDTIIVLHGVLHGGTPTDR